MVAVNNATSGLHISVLALNLSKGDRVITADHLAAGKLCSICEQFGCRYYLYVSIRC